MRNRRLAGKRASIKSVKLGTIPASQTRPWKPANPASAKNSGTLFFEVGLIESSIAPKRYNVDMLKSMTIKELTDLARKDLGLECRVSWRKSRIVEEIIKAQDEKIVAAV